MWIYRTSTPLSLWDKLPHTYHKVKACRQAAATELPMYNKSAYDNWLLQPPHQALVSFPPLGK